MLYTHRKKLITPLYLQMCACSQKFQDHAGVVFHDGSTTQRLDNVRRLSTVVAEETAIISKPNVNVITCVAKKVKVNFSVFSQDHDA